jgi:FSR family fosmidomycin resistance protein-like MFS transporter
MINRNQTNLKVLFALTLVHFTGDFYSAFTTPLFPAFMEKLDLTLAQVGFIAGLNRFLSFIVQPIAGYLSDRYQGRAIILGGLLMAVVFIPLSGIADSYWMLILFISLGSVGSSLFHPSVAGMIPLYAGHRKGFSMSVFNTGGTLAFAAGPFFITAVVAAWGLAVMPATMVIGLMVMIYLWVVVPSPQSEGMASLGLVGTLKRQFGAVWKSIFLIWLVMVLRAVVGQSFMTFMPVLLVSRGYSLVSGGAMITLFTLAGTLSGLMAGYLADRKGSRPIFLVSHLLMTPALLVMLWLPGAWIYAGVFGGRFFRTGHHAVRGHPGPGTGPGRPFHGIQPDDGPGLWPGGCDGAGRRKTGRPVFDRHRVVGGRLHPPGDHSVNFILPKRKPDGSGLNPGKECQ